VLADSLSVDDLTVLACEEHGDVRELQLREACPLLACDRTEPPGHQVSLKVIYWDHWNV